jgi:DNA polymerase I-like protein with 3'-5' exonuclease and polymerase domains
MSQQHAVAEGASAPSVVSTVEQLQEIVDTVLSEGRFCFDVETKGTVERHPDISALFEEEWKHHLASLKTTNSDIIARSRESLESKWRSEIALDPLRNEVFWIGIATKGRSWAIPMGHPHGSVIEPEDRGDGSTVPPPGYRAILKSGNESLAKARYYKPAVFSSPPDQLDKSTVFETLRPLFFQDVLKIGHNVKFDARSVSKYYHGIPPGPYRDTMLMQHVINENLSEYSLNNLLSTNFDGLDAYRRHGKLGSIITQVSFNQAIEYVHLDVRWTWLLHEFLWKRINRHDDLRKCLNQDMEVLHVLMHMENNGINVDHRSMKKLGKELEARLSQLHLDMMQYSSPGFNPDSTKHKQTLLFTTKRDGGLGLKPVKHTNGGSPSVDEESLRKLEKKHPIVPMLIDWSETKKMKSTYVEGLLQKLNKGKLHPSFHLHRTTTGRMSSSNPNLQNIPRDSSVRGLFVAPPGHSLLVADYDQIELRVMCMFSGDKKMSEFFLTGEDIHSGAAALILDKKVEDVTDEERQMGKGVNFLTAYGGGAQKLAATTGVTVDRARYVIDRYYQQFKGITTWKQSVLRTAVKQGYVSTLSGRRRRLMDIKSSDSELRARAERQAINSVVQGSAADICKEAMIDVYKAFIGTNANMLVQVHDELVVSVPTEEINTLMPVLVNAMGHGRVISGIPLKVSCHSAGSWSEAKGK